jgi:two-component system, chemotaxis family, chemotaxis protein CheY
MKKQILIVDDSENIRDILIFTLEKAGHSVLSAVDGKDALKHLDGKTQIDLIITDINLPVMDGISMIKKIRTNNKHQYVPILILTSECQIDKKNEAKEAGATGWIIKPFVPEKLLTAISRLVR